MNNIAKIYANLIKIGIKTLTEVPKNLQQEVKQLLNEK